MRSSLSADQRRSIETEWCGAGVVVCLEQGANDPAHATTTQSSLASLKSRMVLPFCYQLIQVVLEKMLLKGNY